MDTLYIATATLPENEREHAEAVTVNYHALQSCVETLNAAVALFDHCLDSRMPPGSAESLLERREHNLMLSRWKNIAARSGAIAIYEFHRIEQAIDTSISLCPTLQPMVDSVARKEAARLFEKSFPEFMPVRLFAAHGHEMVRFPADAKKHTTSGGVTIDGIVLDAGEILLSGTLMNRTYVSTYQGKAVGYELTAGTAQNLADVLQARYRALAPIGNLAAGLPGVPTAQNPTLPEQE